MPRILITLLAASFLTASFALHVAVMAAFTFRWDKAAAVTTIPFLVWSAAGVVLALAAAPFLRSRLPLLAVVVWVASALACADEPRSFLAVGREKPAAGPPPPSGGQPVLRVITHNCGDLLGRAEAARHLGSFNPDIVFLQEAPHLGLVRDLCGRLYGREGSFLYQTDCTILARGELTKSAEGPARELVQATLTLPDGRQVELLNLHLIPGVTDLRLWRPSTWKRHYYNRRARRQQVGQAIGNLLRTAGQRPSIVAGDFNAPPPDATYRILARYFTDTCRQAGTGWSNTYSNSLPLLRIDQVWTTPEFRAVRHAAFRSPRSDHRFVVTDLVTTEPQGR